MVITSSFHLLQMWFIHRWMHHDNPHIVVYDTTTALWVVSLNTKIFFEYLLLFTLFRGIVVYIYVRRHVFLHVLCLYFTDQLIPHGLVCAWPQTGTFTGKNSVSALYSCALLWVRFWRPKPGELVAIHSQPIYTSF